MAILDGQRTTTMANYSVFIARISFYQRTFSVRMDRNCVSSWTKSNIAIQHDVIFRVYNDMIFHVYDITYKGKSITFLHYTWCMFIYVRLFMYAVAKIHTFTCEFISSLYVKDTSNISFIYKRPTARYGELSLIARFIGPTWGLSGADRTQVGPVLAPWTLLSGTKRSERVSETYIAGRVKISDMSLWSLTFSPYQMWNMTDTSISSNSITNIGNVIELRCHAC